MAAAKLSSVSFQSSVSNAPAGRATAGAKLQPASGLVFASELARIAPAKAPSTLNRKDPFVQLEAVFLRSFVEAMLPTDNVGMFGTGNAGEYWRSMLADQMASSIAVSGRIGIANLLRSRFNK